MAKLSTEAKDTHKRYGTSSRPATGRTCQKATSVARIAAHSAKISRNASPGRWKPKKRNDHVVLSNSWTAKRTSATRAPAQPACRHTSHTATPIIT